MFKIKYANWKSVVEVYFRIPNPKLKKYLQWYPFTKGRNKARLISEDYFNNFIDKGYFLLDPTCIETQSNYMQRSNGQYRQSQLISPELYLILQAVCLEISQNIQIDRYPEISTYYSGDIDNLSPFYGLEYSKFYKELISEKDFHDYFIKIDISNFFLSIDIDNLFSKVESYSQNIDQVDLLMYKELIKYIGNGSYPIIENSMGTSYLATEVYLSSIDNAIYDYFKKDNKITNFKMVRYVDDLYILFDSKVNDINLNIFFENFMKFANELFNINKLNLNFDKTKFDESSKLTESLYGLFYAEEVNGEEFDIYEIDEIEQERLLLLFLEQIKEEVETFYILRNKKYMEIVENTFKIEESNLSSREILNRILYSGKLDYKKQSIKDKILDISNIYVITTSPGVFLTLLLNTKDGKTIKETLNTLFNKSRDSGWVMNETDLSINYLLSRSFRHEDLIETLKEELGENGALYKYIQNYCMEYEWITSNENAITIFEKLEITKLTLQILFLYLCNKKRDDFFAAYSYYKSYFDRITAEFEYYINDDRNKPAYNKYYTANNLKDFYKEFEEYKKIIDEAGRLRNFNPINHGTAQLMSDSSITKNDLESSLKDLNYLIISFLNKMYAEISDTI